MKNVSLLTTGLALGIVCNASHAHHGSNGQFDVAKQISVSGVVTDIRFVNPHSYVYFDVTTADGAVQPWRCELRAGSMLRRTGWTTDMFATGSRISISGAPARREPFGCMATTITFADGRVVGRQDVIEEVTADDSIVPSAELDDGTPNFSGNWVALPRTRGPAPDGPPGGGRRGPQFPQSEAGIAASAGFDREDNPRFHCQPTNLFMDWTFDEHVNTVQQSAMRIVMKFGFMSIVRTIHLDTDSHPAKLTAARAGHSIGSWDADVLVVDTVGFLPGYLDATFSGSRHSDAMHVVERFALSDDGNTLNRSYTVNDPLYLASPFEGNDSVVRTAVAFEPYDCEDLTEERVDGF